MRDHDISQRRACKLVGVDPKTVRRDRPPDNPEIRAEMKAIAHKRRRFGYRRIGVMLERKGMTMNHKKLYRRDCCISWARPIWGLVNSLDHAAANSWLMKISSP